MSEPAAPPEASTSPPRLLPTALCGVVLCVVLALGLSWWRDHQAGAAARLQAQLAHDEGDWLRAIAHAERAAGLCGPNQPHVEEALALLEQIEQEARLAQAPHTADLARRSALSAARRCGDAARVRELGPADTAAPRPLEPATRHRGRPSPLSRGVQSAAWLGLLASGGALAWRRPARTRLWWALWTASALLLGAARWLA